MSPIQAAPAQLADMVGAMRPDWEPAHISGAISAAQSGGVDFGIIAEVLTRLARDERAQPRDLTEMVRNHLRKQVHGPEVFDSGLAAVRAAAGIKP
jgi:hypothetical protein